jgi:hypothetical protein
MGRKLGTAFAFRATLLRLVRVLPDGGMARRRADRGEVDERALASLVDARLVSVDDEAALDDVCEQCG